MLGFESSSRPATGTPEVVVFWAAELDYLMTNHPGFVKLDDAFWDARHKLAVSINSADVTDTKPDLTDVAYKRLLQEYGAAVGLLKMAVLDRAYQGRTGFNPFALLRIGKDAMAACVRTSFLSRTSLYPPPNPQLTASPRTIPRAGTCTASRSPSS